MWGIVAAIAVVVVILSGVLGGTLPSTGTNGGVPAAQGCDFCKQLPGYWRGLNGWQKTWMLSWYLWKTADCFLKHC